MSMMHQRVLILALVLLSTACAFVPSCRTAYTASWNIHNVKFGQNDDEDLSFLSSREMTREEMKQLNEDNERVMNSELAGMTIFSLIISIPMLYLVWVGFFAETVEFGAL